MCQAEVRGRRPTETPSQKHRLAQAPQKRAGQKACLTTPRGKVVEDWVSMSSHQPHTSLPDTSAQVLGQRSPAAAKITLFRSLFRGRQDVYPRRFERRKTGKSGYAPVCANE
jgi:hypothetical protein